MSLDYRIATPNHAASIVKLFCENGNRHRWSLAKWKHYYVDYPIGNPTAFIACDGSNTVIAHYGLLPTNIAGYNVMLGVHSYVRSDFRGLEVISQLLTRVYEFCDKEKIAFICGFPNKDFNNVLSFFLGWETIGFLRFTENPRYDISSCKDFIQFEYPTSWYLWKFSRLSDCYIQSFRKDGKLYHQILKTRKIAFVNADDHKIDKLHFWHPDFNSKQEQPQIWSQPFAIRILRSGINPEALEMNRWLIEMGDSDAFEWNKKYHGVNESIHPSCEPQSEKMREHRIHNG